MTPIEGKTPDLTANDFAGAFGLAFVNPHSDLPAAVTVLPPDAGAAPDLNFTAKDVAPAAPDELRLRRDICALLFGQDAAVYASNEQVLLALRKQMAELEAANGHVAYLRGLAKAFAQESLALLTALLKLEEVGQVKLADFKRGFPRGDEVAAKLHESVRLAESRAGQIEEMLKRM